MIDNPPPDSLKPFAKLPASSRFWLLWVLFFVCMGVFSVVSSLIVMSMAGISSLGDLSRLSDTTDPSVVFALKIAQLISAVGAFIVPAHIFAVLNSTSYASYLNLDNYSKAKKFLIAILCMMASLPLVNWLATINSQLHLPEFLQTIETWMRESEDNAERITKAFLQMETIGDLTLNVFVIGFIAAIAEELFFRGALQKVLKEWTKSTHAAVWITSILFSALHLQFFGFIPRLILGCVLGYMKEWTGSLWVPITAHLVNNGGAVVVSYLIQKNKISEAAESVGSQENEWIAVLVSVFLVCGLLYLLYKDRQVGLSEPKAVE